MTSDVRLSDDESDSETEKNGDGDNESRLQQQVCVRRYEFSSVYVSPIVEGRNLSF